MSGASLPATCLENEHPQAATLTRSDYFNKSDLKDYGWTDALIRKFLGKADMLTANPRYRRAAPQQLYRIDRVTRAEQSEEYQLELDRTAKRRVARLAVTETLMRKTLEQVEQLVVIVELVEKEKLIQLACESYNRRQAARRSVPAVEPATPESDAGFLQRICVNYIRHHRTVYHGLLATVRGKIGVQQAAHEIRCQVLTAIAEKYPDLAAECVRQSAGSRHRPSHGVW